MDLGLEGQAVLLAGASRGIGLAAARAVRETIARFGRVDVLVTLVGGSRGDPGVGAPEADWDAVVAANLRAAVTMTRLVLPSMKDRRSGAVIQVPSVFGRAGGGAG